MEEKLTIFDKPHYESRLGKKKIVPKTPRSESSQEYTPESPKSSNPFATLKPLQPHTNSMQSIPRDIKFIDHGIKHIVCVFKNKKFVNQDKLCDQDHINNIKYCKDNRYMVTCRVEYTGNRCDFKICPSSYAHHISTKEETEVKLINGYTTSIVNTEEQIHELGIFPTDESIKIHSIHWNLFQLV